MLDTSPPHPPRALRVQPLHGAPGELADEPALAVSCVLRLHQQLDEGGVEEEEGGGGGTQSIDEAV